MVRSQQYTSASAISGGWRNSPWPIKLLEMQHWEHSVKLLRTASALSNAPSGACCLPSKKSRRSLKTSANRTTDCSLCYLLADGTGASGLETDSITRPSECWTDMTSRQPAQYSVLHLPDCYAYILSHTHKAHRHLQSHIHMLKAILTNTYTANAAVPCTVYRDIKHWTLPVFFFYCISHCIYILYP